MTTIKTRIFSYSFDISKPEDAAAYAALCEKLKAVQPRQMKSHDGGKSSYYKAAFDKPEGVEITLETKHLFTNQWNTAAIEGVSEKGLRVFDWAEDYMLSGGAYGSAYSAKYHKRGHYLEQTPEMAEIRRNTCKCRYCGKQEPAQKGYVFCPHCIDSEYLKEDDLYLTRMMPVEDGDATIPPLTKAEKEHLLPLYVAAQTHGATERGKARIAKKRADILARRDAAVAAANEEFDGFTWLMDKGWNTDNVIYYSHTRSFGFGWRKKLGEAELSKLLDMITEFPFSYTIDTETRGKLQGMR